jgi:flagellar L-ring protein precursor FlgH
MLRLIVAWITTATGWAATVESPLDRFIREGATSSAAAPYTSGSLYAPGSILGDLAGDFRGLNVNDLITIVVSDRATALAKGTSTSKRTSSASASIPSLAGPARGRVLPNLAQLQGAQQLDGQGETSREMSLTATLTARITHVLPNGNFIVEGTKDIIVNAERQTVTVRGLGRWTDLSAANQLASDRLAYLEIKVQGKGIVGDAVRRPNILYRILLGLLPF